MESVISNAERLMIQKALFPSNKYSKNVFNKAIQELLMTNNKIAINTDELEKFKRIHAFLSSKLSKKE
jgi:hypothetical protein